MEEQYTERAFIEPGREPYEAERREAKLVPALPATTSGRWATRSSATGSSRMELEPLYADLVDET